MKFIIIAFTPILFSFQLLAQNNSTQEYLFEGSWTIDLRPNENADPYLKEFVVELDSNNVFHGIFYGSEFENRLINNNWEKLYFAFSTKDAKMNISTPAIYWMIKFMA